jgi:AcrR family transcriptional regulator
METEETGPRSTRNAEHTRAVVLAAAAQALAERGTGASLAYIAKKAGVSKGGLMHHFASRDALIVALVEEANRKFRANVLNYLDLSENIPGKMLRAYVRALCSGSEATMQYYTAAPIWAGIHDLPEVTKISRADAAWWAEQLALDGLSHERILVVRRAAEGLAVALAYGEESLETVTAARDVLLALASGASFTA